MERLTHVAVDASRCASTVTELFHVVNIQLKGAHAVTSFCLLRCIRHSFNAS